MNEVTFTKEVNIVKLNKELKENSPVDIFKVEYDLNTFEGKIFTVVSITTAQEQAIYQIVLDHDKNYTQKELDFHRYLKRANVKNEIIAQMASENMERVRNGIWTVSDLVNLTEDPELKLILDDINTLSFELAHNRIDTITNPIVTTDIKNQWKQMLVDNFYL